jgi:hypothetical protein
VWGALRVSITTRALALRCARCCTLKNYAPPSVASSQQHSSQTVDGSKLGFHTIVFSMSLFFLVGQAGDDL